MSTSSEARVVRGPSAATATGLGTPELRTGAWTRLGGVRVLGDDVTEQTLSALAESTRAAARAQGYAVGWAEGRRESAVAAQLAAEEREARAVEAETRREAEHRAAVAALESAAQQVGATLARVCAEVEDRAAELALELTRELVGHELAVGTTPGEHAVRRALALLPEGAVVRVRLHPDVVASPAVSALTARGVTVVPDPTLGTGDAMVEADDHVLDLRLDTALDRVRGVLLR